MRLDLFLKASRLIPARSVAQRYCEEGLIFVNGSTAKPSKDVKPADEIELKRRGHILKVEITKLPSTRQVSKAEAPDLYRVVSDEKIEGNEHFS